MMDNKVFVDKSDNIYLINNGILYNYDGKYFYPFLERMYNIKQCFTINNQYYVHHSDTISVFLDALNSVKTSDMYWITRNIDKICYHSKLNLIVTLENGEVYINCNVGDHNNDDYYDTDSDNDNSSENDKILRICLSRNTKGLKYRKFDDIKIIDRLLLVYIDDNMKIYKLRKGHVDYIKSICIKKCIFDRIYGTNNAINIFFIDNGNMILTDDVAVIQTVESCVINDNMIEANNIYLYLDQSSNEFKLCCYYNNKVAPKLIKDIIQLLSPTEYITDSHYYNITSIVIPQNKIVSIVNGMSTQVIMIDDKFYIVGTQLKELVFDNELIVFDMINIGLDKIDTKLIIDIDDNIDIVDQLINIIPNIYRLNSEMEFVFEQANVNSSGRIVSYGDGVTRQTFSILRIGIDAILKTNFTNMNPALLFNLGKLFYFCYREGSERYFFIHPYFFYLLSHANSSDDISLIKHFKRDCHELYCNQYNQYHCNPDMLVELDLGLTSVRDYVKYLMASDLNEDQCHAYELFYDGFMYFKSREKYHNVIQLFPITYYINELIANDYFKAKINYVIGHDIIDINGTSKHFGNFCNLFNIVFQSLSRTEKSIFSANITGSQYYHGDIYVVYAYIPGNTNQCMYTISTCNTELTFNMEPTVENITSVITMLTVPDKILIN